MTDSNCNNQEPYQHYMTAWREIPFLKKHYLPKEADNLLYQIVSQCDNRLEREKIIKPLIEKCYKLEKDSKTQNICEEFETFHASETYIDNICDSFYKTLYQEKINFFYDLLFFTNTLIIGVTLLAIKNAIYEDN